MGVNKRKYNKSEQIKALMELKALQNTLPPGIQYNNIQEIFQTYGKHWRIHSIINRPFIDYYEKQVGYEYYVDMRDIKTNCYKSFFFLLPLSTNKIYPRK